MINTSVNNKLSKPRSAMSRLTNEQLQYYIKSMEMYTHHYAIAMNHHLDYLDKKKKFKNLYAESKSQQHLELYQKYSSLCELYSERRQYIRFNRRTNFIKDFVNLFVRSYSDLLKMGRFTLEYLYQNKEWIDTPTAIENSLYQEDWPILQMIELNNYMYTTASTNSPHILFQKMFLEGIVPKIILDKLVKELRLTTTYEYFIYDLEKFDAEKPTVIKCSNHRIMEEWLEAYIQPAGLENKPWINDLAVLFVIDPVKERRDLYSKMIDIFRRISQPVKN